MTEDRSSEAPGQEAIDGDAAPDETEALRVEVQSLQDQMLRQRADLDNYRKRLDRTTEELVRRARVDIFLSVLSVADDLERALTAAGTSAADGALRAGVELTLERLREVLKGHGVQPIEATDSFDPRLHEAVATVETGELPAGAIVDEIQRGYRWGDEVLRATQVRVAVAPTD